MTLGNCGYSRASIDLSEEGLALGRDTGLRCWEVFFHGHRACSALVAGNLKVAEQALQQMGSLLSSQRFLDVGLYHYAAAYLALQAGDPDGAVVQARSSLQAAENAGAPFSEFLTRLALSASLHAQGRHNPILADICRR